PRLQTNLMRPELQVERMLRAKKPWAAAAAAAILLGMGALALSYAMEHRAVGADVVVSAIKESENTVNLHKNNETKYANAEKEEQAEEKAVKSIIAGTDERLNWIKLHKFIGDVVPRPDGSNLPASAKANPKFWNAKARQAYDKYLELQAAGKAAGAVRDKTRADLIQFNIEGVGCRYTDDLGAFWTA